MSRRAERGFYLRDGTIVRLDIRIVRRAGPTVAESCLWWGRTARNPDAVSSILAGRCSLEMRLDLQAGSVAKRPGTSRFMQSMARQGLTRLGLRQGDPREAPRGGPLEIRVVSHGLARRCEGRCRNGCRNRGSWTRGYTPSAWPGTGKSQRLPEPRKLDTPCTRLARDTHPWSQRLPEPRKLDTCWNIHKHGPSWRRRNGCRNRGSWTRKETRR